MNQKGFTLIEILVVMVVGGMVMAGALLTIYQIAWGSSRSNDQVVALTDLNYATRWIRQDLQMAQYTDLTDGDPVPQSSLALYWLDMTLFGTDNRSTHSSDYTLSGIELLRTYDDTTSVVGRYITSIGFTQNNRIITCNITATSPGTAQRSETVVFSVRMQTEEVE